MLAKNKISLYGIITGFLILLSFIFTEPPEGLNRTAWLTAGIAILMTVWWITEAVPIYITKKEIKERCQREKTEKKQQ